MSQSKPRRSPGRPAQATPGATRDAIVAAARTRFAAGGFAGASLRSIAHDAGVDPSLIRHYFGGKAGLLVATMELPFNPLERLAEVMIGGRHGLAERLLQTFLASWDPHRDVFSAIFRTQIVGVHGESPVQMLLLNVVTRTVTEALEGEDAALRASLVASQLLGLAMLRYIIELKPLATAPVDDVVQHYAKPMQILIDG